MSRLCPVVDTEQVDFIAAVVTHKNPHALLTNPFTVKVLFPYSEI